MLATLPSRRLGLPALWARLRVVATIEDPIVVRPILTSVRLPRPAATVRPGPPAAVPAWPC
jgi:hypothetical protein